MGEFEEKEKHRLEVERKRKEEKENERLECLLRDERNRQAEKDIADAKKMEGERAKREEERMKRAEAKKLEEERVRRDAARKRREEERAKELKRAVLTGCPTVPMVQRDSSTFVNYGLDIESGDSTDDDGAPAKRVPPWALGSRLNKQLTRQFYTDIEPDEIFVNAMQPLRLEIIFNSSKTRYFKRTSSAHWSSPPL